MSIDQAQEAFNKRMRERKKKAKNLRAEMTAISLHLKNKRERVIM
jgi:hypothetical protein